MRRSLAVAGAALGAALAVAGCRQETGPPDTRLSHHRATRFARFHVDREPVHGGDREVWTGRRAIRERVTREVLPLPHRRRPPARAEDTCGPGDRSHRGVAVHCVQRSEQDVDRSDDTVLRDRPDD
ncbi:hypothetical protein GCM10023196_071110 [Actinoallomurus vinaceus]|uniref:Lipoprotein n=1 Tax=Actinoallomurus vinaceus TaxID=1080074 RepID=A0ABP8UK05_9ACTN